MIRADVKIYAIETSSKARVPGADGCFFLFIRLGDHGSCMIRLGYSMVQILRRLGNESVCSSNY